ncbi:maleylpyruvate isomerase family mycothiol-dependent enzyme [Intrasporangium sp. DVR]|uniref:maleylpyruvate isomerase family mycothiol-dependent enzyme n=1 Tax=Intrasporangium sp. DVR TaxID=3127867 RepID=UPI00313A62BF
MPLSSPPAEGRAPVVPYLDHLREESARFRELLAGAAGSERVPTCEDWDADSLLWHLAEVQWFWGAVAEGGMRQQDQVRGLDAQRVARPSDHAGLLAHFDRSTERLQRVLASLDPQTELWMWHTDHTAGYISRRQAHEALIHRIDAELTIGAEPSPVDCRLAADGVDEVLRVMRGFPAEYDLRSAALGPSVTIAVVDGFHTWTVMPVHVTGVDPDGDRWDERRLAVWDGPDQASVAEVAGTAGDLDCWLWNRPSHGEVTRTGDPAALALVDEVLASPIR